MHITSKVLYLICMLILRRRICLLLYYLPNTLSYIRTSSLSFYIGTYSPWLMRCSLFQNPRLLDENLIEQYCDFLKRLFDNETCYKQDQRYVMDWIKHALKVGAPAKELRFNFASEFKSDTFTLIPNTNTRWKYQNQIIDVLKTGKYNRKETLEIFLE